MKTLKAEHDSKLRALNVQLYDTISEKDEIFKKVRPYESVERVLSFYYKNVNSSKNSWTGRKTRLTVELKSSKTKAVGSCWN